MWDNIRDFITYHYITPRKDTKFWKEASSTQRWSPRLTRLMTMWKYKMPREVDYINDIGNNFYSIGNTLYYQIAIGMKLFDSKLAKKELESYGLYDDIKRLHEVVKENLEEQVPTFMKTNDYYNSL